MKKVLITGGAGYIGSVFARLLLNKNYEVRILDKLMFGGESIIELLNYSNFDFIKGDIRNKKDCKKAVEDINFVVNLAAIVGDPACAKAPELAKETNLDATKQLYLFANESGVERFVFASTCSNYGKSKNPDKLRHENSMLHPISLYAQTKVLAEKYLLSQLKTNKTKPICLRFATVYGLSPRIRFDLTVNEFTKEVSLQRELLIFGEQFWRPYCHVYDIANSLVQVIENDELKVAFEVFNVGNTHENYTKKMIAEELLKLIPTAKIKYVKKNEDPRDYKVSFEKIRDRLGFKTTKNLSEGIYQVNKVIVEGILNEPDHPRYRNS